VPEFIIFGRLAQPRLISVLFGYAVMIAVIGGLLASAIAG